MTRRLQAEIAAMPGPADVVEKVIRYAGGAVHGLDRQGPGDHCVASANLST